MQYFKALYVLPMLGIAMLPCVAAAQVDVLHAFPETQTDGVQNASSSNSAPMLINASGALYGATTSGGTSKTNATGTIFKLTPPGQDQSTWSETILHDFHGPDGESPTGGLVMDRNGVLYGTTFSGGRFGGGTVFKLTPPAQGESNWTLQTLLQLGAPKAKLGGNPFGGLTIDADGALYGTDLSGDVFKLSPPLSGSGAWTETKLANICPGGSEGTLTLGPGGVIYGTVFQDAPGCHPGPGWVFELLPPSLPSNKWHLKTLSALPQGENPFGGLLLDASGSLFGTTLGGNKSQCGLVYKLTPPVSGERWPETVLYSFSGPDGCQPTGNLVEDSSGALYGTTQLGGNAGYGTVFRLKQQNGAWTETVIANLDAATGGNPTAGITFDGVGNIYGITTTLGPNGNGNGGGTVFAIPAADVAQRAWTTRPLP